MMSINVALGKIGGRYYWAVQDMAKCLAEESDTRIADGFAEGRDEAIEAAAAILEQTDPGAADYLSRHSLSKRDRAFLATGNRYGASPVVKAYGSNIARGWNWARASVGSAHAAARLYRKHHGRKRAAKASGAQSDLGCLWTWCEPYDHDMWRPRWKPHRITKITRRRVFIWYEPHRGQLSFDRTQLEREGSAGAFKRSTAYERFYSQVGMETRESERAARGRETHAVRSSKIEILGISGDYTRAQIMSAFREKSKTYHPDHGGTPEQFIRLCEAKDLALTRCA